MSMEGEAGVFWKQLGLVNKFRDSLPEEELSNVFQAK